MIWIAVILCVVGSFVFAGLEAGLLSMNRVRLRHYARLGTKAAVKLEKLLERPERVLVTILLVTNLLNIFAVVISTLEIVRLIGPWGYLIAFGIWLPVYLLGLQLLPKSLFRRFPYRALASFAEVLRLTEVILSPIVIVGTALAAVIFPRSKREQRKAFAGREEVKYFIAQSESVGTLGRVERAMINNVVDFRAVKAQDVMVPMVKVRTVDASASIEELFRLSREHNLDRFPVCRADGQISGLVRVFDVLMEQRPGERQVGAYQRRIVSAEADEPAYNVIRKLRAARSGLATVRDGQRNTLGIVSIEDLIRRLVSVAVPEAPVPGA